MIERYVPLKRAGANYVACCPFHGEKTPSFTVSQPKQFYHCFGCGAHGTAIGFMMEYAGAGFIDAVKDLAQSAGMQVPEIKTERPRGKTEEGDDLYAVLLKAAHYYRQQLKNTPVAIEYLKSRGLSGEIAKDFGFGYAPGGWQNLQQEFSYYNAKALVAAGLVIQGDGGKRYDRFRDRIMFPIVDPRGHVIGFGGRVLANGEPKYLNSPETALFEKGRELYGLYQARRAIRDVGRVIVVEGYMDVVALAQHGIGYAVATLGTATTPVHVQKLLRQVEEVVFCFDGDDAGRRAAWRALENSLDQLADGKQLSFLFLPQGEDPDSYVRKLGKEGFEELLGDAEPLSRFLLRELASRGVLRTAEGRAKLLKEAEPLVKKVAAPNFNLMLREELAALTKIAREELDGQYGIKPKRYMRGTPPKTKAVDSATLVQQLIAMLLSDPEIARHADRARLAGSLDMVGVRIDKHELKALDRLLEILTEGHHIASATEFFRDTEFSELFEQIELRRFRGEDGMDVTQAFVDGWANLLVHVKNDVERARMALQAAGTQPRGAQTVSRDI